MTSHSGRTRVSSIARGLVVVLAAVLAGQVTHGQGAQSLNGAQQQSAVSDPTDSYYYGDRRVSLTRSVTEFVVRFEGEPLAGQQRMVETLGSAASLGSEIRSGGRTFRVLSAPVPESRAARGTAPRPSRLEQLRSMEGVDFVAPVLTYPATGLRMLLSDEIVVKLRPGGTRDELVTISASLGLTVLKPLWGDEYVLRLDHPNADDPLEKSRLLKETGRFEWAEPNFIQEYQKLDVPNDPLFGQQWHLNNTGQGGGTVGADTRMPSAWDLQQGSPNITIAVIDDGVEMTHEDLAGNIFTNTGEIAGNGIDDDGNGFVDDVRGWDFSNNDNDPSPFSTLDSHGTAVAGVAAARGGNGIGVSGACRLCRILPVKIFSPNYAGDTAVASAIRYAARFADVLNNSWGGGAPSSVIQSAIQFAVTSGRAGKGSVVLFASGNSASGYATYTITNFPAGTHRFRWVYEKDSSGSSGSDTTWLGWVVFPGGELVNFENSSLPGWTTNGNAQWSLVSDPTHADEGRCFTRAARAGAIGNGQSSYFEAVKTVGAGQLTTMYWPSSQADSDGLRVLIDLNNDGTFEFTGDLLSGTPAVVSSVSYPAAHPESIAVGASTNFDCRSHYSQYGSELAFVAPSSGGPLNLGIATTDRTGASGYGTTNYTSSFGGTSSATPLASGIAGLILSRNPTLTTGQVRQIMQSTADKVGPEPYVGDRNNRYGYGRLNAYSALLATPSPNVPATIATQPLSQAIVSGQSVQLSVSATGTSPLTYQWYQGSSGTTSNPIAGATASTYTTPALTGPASYWVRVSNGYGVADSNTASITIGQPAAVTSPSPGTTLAGASVTFQWSAGSGVQEYYLELGTAVGGSQIYSASQGTGLSRTVQGLPTNGTTVHLRLWSRINGTWLYNLYTYTASTAAAAMPAVLTTPTPGTTLPGATVTFQWSMGSGVTQYWFELGTTVGGSQIYSASQGTATSATISGLPANGSTVHVRLWSLINGTWQSNLYTYTAAAGQSSAPAVLMSPTPGTTLAGATVTFQWSPGSGVTQYWLELGTTVGGSQIYSASQGMAVSRTVMGLPSNGSTIHVRLWSLINEAWQSNLYTYTAATGQSSAPAVLTSPAPGTTLPGASVTFQWSPGSGVTQYWLELGTTLGGSQLYSASQGTGLAQTISGLPTTGMTIHVRLWSLINGAWQANFYTYTAATM